MEAITKGENNFQIKVMNVKYSLQIFVFIYKEIHSKGGSYFNFLNYILHYKGNVKMRFHYENL